MRFAFALAVAIPAAFAFQHDSARFVRRAAHARRDVACVAANYTTPNSLAPGAMNSTTGCGSTYKVQNGDSCESILVNSNSTLSLKSFMAINPIDSACWNLQIGSSYCVAQSTCTAAGALSIADGCTQYAAVAANQTFAAFRAANNVTFQDLADLNPNVTSSLPIAGAFYCISNGTTPQAVAASSNDGHTSTEDVVTTETLAPITTSQPAPAVETEPTSTSSSSSTSTYTPPARPTTKIEVEHTTTASPPPPPSPSPSPAGSSLQMSGDATFFAPGLGSCGWENSASDFIGAASADLYAITGTGICGSMITLSRGGKSVTVKIVDECPPCTAGSIDLSPAAFDQIATPAEGRVPMTWDAASLGPKAVAAMRAAGL